MPAKIQQLINHIPPPRILNWRRQIDQHYTTDYNLLIVSGCSFTNNSTWLGGPVSWAGYTKDRCGIPVCEDWSFPGAGNEYIANSILARIEDLDQDQIPKTLVIVGWSGLDRKEELSYHDSFDENNQSLVLDNIKYHRLVSSTSDTPNSWKKAEIWRSWKNIIFTKNYLENKKISHAFFQYCNLMEPPFLPRRDRTPEWPGNIGANRLRSLKSIDWIVPHEQSFFEYCFYQEKDLFEDDLFHPNIHGHFAWTDEVLLPNLAKKGLIFAVDRK